jgi:FkbM family methyltransferase
MNYVRFLRTPSLLLCKISRLIKDKYYRRVLWSRIVLFLLSKSIARLEYIGIKDQEDRTLYHIRDKAITLHALALGYYHKREFNEILSYVKSLKALPNASVMIEVGANIGTTTLAAYRSEAFSRILAIEPDADNLRLLRANLVINDFAVQDVIQAAVSDEDKTLYLKVSEQNLGDHQCFKAEDQAPKNDLIATPAFRLDTILQQQGITAEEVSFVWVDTQGFEGFVLAGGTSILKRAQAVWVVEYWPAGLRRAGCEEIFYTLVAKHFTKAIDVRTKESYASQDFSTLDKRLAKEEDFTDLILLP